MNFFKVVFFTILICIFLSACAQENLVFYGDSANWEVQYEINKEVNCGAQSGYIKYIGNSPVPERLEYSIYKSEGSVSLDEYGVFTLPLGCSNASEGSEIEAIIKWDNQSDTIPLTVK